MLEDDQYIVVKKWMITKLGLKNGELLCYALIYGFSQDGESEFHGSLNYIAINLGITQRQAVNITKSLCEKGYIEKIELVQNNVKLVHYKANLWGSEKISEGVVKKFQRGSEKISPNNIIDNIEDNLSKEIYKESSQTDSPYNAESEMMQAENRGMGTPINTKKEGKKESSAKERKGEIELPFQSEEFVSLWEELLQEPKWKDKSVNALKRNLKDLEKMGEAGAIASIEQTIKRGYQGVFEVKGFTKSSGVNLNANAEWDD